MQLRRRDLDSSGIALSVDVQTDRKVYANFTEVEQVTLNFVINAQQSIEVAERPRGRILIRVFDAGKRVRLEVQDDGPGVTPEDEPKLFQPFFTTKPVGKGTGLGLSVSYGIIESYGGTIGHRANEWGGATFFFELPVTEPAARTSIAVHDKRDRRNPMTDRLYYRDPYLREFDATVVRVDRRDDRLLVTLDRTAFYPTSGGQPFDTGRLGSLRVVDVVDEEDGSITHVVEPEPRTRTRNEP